MTFLRGVPGAVDDVAVAWQNDIEDDRSLIWDTVRRRQGVVRGFDMTLDAGTLSVTFTAGAAVVEERGTDITGNGRGYYLCQDTTTVVVFDTPSAAVRNDALVFCWADPQYGTIGASADGPGPQIVVVKGVSGTSTPRTDAQIQTAIGVGGWFRYADVVINPGDTQIGSGNVTTFRPTVYEVATVKRSAAFTIPDQVNTLIPWDSIIGLDNKGMLVPVVANGIVTATAGRFECSGSIALDYNNPTALLHIALRVNGAQHRILYRGGFNPSSFAPTLISYCIETALAAGDTVSVSVFHTRGANVLTYVADPAYVTDLTVRKLPSTT